MESRTERNSLNASDNGFKWKKGKYYMIDVDNISFGTDEIGFVFGKPEGILYIFDIRDIETEVYDVLSEEAFVEGTLDLRGYSYRMFNSETLEEIFDDDEEE